MSSPNPAEIQPSSPKRFWDFKDRDTWQKLVWPPFAILVTSCGVAVAFCVLVTNNKRIDALEAVNHKLEHQQQAQKDAAKLALETIGMIVSQQQESEDNTDYIDKRFVSTTQDIFDDIALLNKS